MTEDCMVNFCRFNYGIRNVKECIRKELVVVSFGLVKEVENLFPKSSFNLVHTNVPITASSGATIPRVAKCVRPVLTLRTLSSFPSGLQGRRRVPTAAPQSWDTSWAPGRCYRGHSRRTEELRGSDIARSEWACKLRRPPCPSWAEATGSRDRITKITPPEKRSLP